MHVASNSNPLIGLAKGAVFSHLPRLFEKIYIAPVVKREVCEDGLGRPGDAELRQALSEGWITVQSPGAAEMAKVTSNLSLDDREVLATALAVRSRFLLSDDQGVARAATQHAIICLTTVDLLVLLREQGHVMALRPVFDMLGAQGFKIAPERVQAALKRVGESG